MYAKMCHDSWINQKYSSKKQKFIEKLVLFCIVDPGKIFKISTPNPGNTRL